MVAAVQPDGSLKVDLKNLLFVPSTLSASAANVVFCLANQDGCDKASCSHTMVIHDAAGKTVAESDYVFPGEARVFAINSLSPGTYPFICSVGFHANFGMTGTLTVT